MANRKAPPGLEASLSSLNSLDNDTSVPSSANIDTQTSKWTSASTSLTASPAQSREPSPIRTTANTKPGRTSRSSTPSPRSRKNSVQDLSPTRTRTNPSTTSTISRQISAATTPSLPPHSSSTETVLRTPIPQKPLPVQEASKSSPRWPISPRLKSPPPVLKPTNLTSSSRKSEPETPVINVQRATPSPHVEPPIQSTSDIEADDQYLPSGMKTPNRGPSSGSTTLETVQEVSQPNTPGPALSGIVEKLEETAASQGQNGSAPSSIKASQSATNSESGSDSGSVKTDTRRPSSTAPPPLLHSRQSSSALRYGSRNQTTGESSSRNMIVETEEVNNMPKLSLNPKEAGSGASGSLRTRPSTETIKPKKEKKKHHRKPASVASGNGEQLQPIPTPKLRHCCSTRSFSANSSRSPPKFYGQASWNDEAGLNPSGQPLKRAPQTRAHSITSQVANLLTLGPRPASSKADIFEAKVASAVEEANSSDSDETFVYDSNPPDVDRPRRYHSRTPSATSMASQLDRNGMRSIHSIIEANAQNPHVKKNMKFVSAYNSSGEPTHGEDDGRGTGRSNMGSARGTTRHHHHPSRWGRNSGNNHPSLFDNDSPFPNAARTKFSGNTSRQSSNPPSPRFNMSKGWMSSTKKQSVTPSGYDMDDTTTGADDERTPLLQPGTVRSIRSNRSRRGMTLRNLESQSYHQNPTFLNRFASCLVLTVMLLLVVTGAIGFMFATSQPLSDIKLIKIGNVLASEQELMFDLTVQAHNPNVVVVMIDSADLEIFAKSPHAGNDSEWWRHPNGEDFAILDSPISDDPDDESSPNMRLGNIVSFDSPLTYEGSFFQNGWTTSSGELRLAKPGNTTESGTERWERIIADEFTLIIKGVLKYTLPLSQKVRKVSISGKTLVKPNSANDPTLKPNSTEIGIY
ncbi:vacuolar segregation subunit 7-domain-containing protein [Xylariaceae sp. FL0255]|nr:vacuolar segregation subunit 7-domain-containing protein [Xylariaceae sp. FL0255]